MDPYARYKNATAIVSETRDYCDPDGASRYLKIDFIVGNEIQAYYSYIYYSKAK